MLPTMSSSALHDAYDTLISLRDKLTRLNGVITPEAVDKLEDKDVETLCRVIRRPGGVNAAGALNQGMQVSAMAEANLKRMCYELRHHTRVSRPVVWADITLLSVRALSAQAEMEASHRDPITLPVMDPKNWTKNFEAIDEHFRGLRGYKKCTLDYVYRPDLVPVLAAVDPQMTTYFIG